MEIKLENGAGEIVIYLEGVIWMKLTINELIQYAKENNLDMGAEIKINGCELNHIFVRNETIYLDETECGDNED